LSFSSFGDGLIVRQQSEPSVTCTISLTSPSVKDDVPLPGKVAQLFGALTKIMAAEIND